MVAHVLLFLCLFAVTVAYALVRGGSAERIAALLFVAGAGLSYLMQSALQETYHGVAVAVCLVDLAMYGGFAWLMQRSDRFWPIWMTGLQGAQVMSHALGLIPIPNIHLVYGFLAQVWCYPMLILLVVAVARSPRQERSSSSGKHR